MFTLLFTGLLIAGAVGWFTRSKQPRAGDTYGNPTGWNPGGFRPQYGTPDGTTSEARAEAGHWVELLGAGLGGIAEITSVEAVGGDPDGSRMRAAQFALADATERHTAAIRQLAQADTVHQIDLAARTALEGLHYLRAGRTALGVDPGPDVRPLSSDGPLLTGTKRVVVQGQEFEAGAEPGQRTPYYYPGGTVQGRNVPAGWYSTPWWKTALVAGGAGLGSLVLVDALFGHGGGLFGGHGGPMHGGPMHGGGMGGPGGMGGDGGFGDFF